MPKVPEEYWKMSKENKKKEVEINCPDCGSLDLMEVTYIYTINTTTGSNPDKIFLYQCKVCKSVFARAK